MSTTIWTYGRSAIQEYFYPADCKQVTVVRNLQETHWTIYDLRDECVRMVPNPYAARNELRFREITDLPFAGEKFGSRPEHDCIGKPSVNYAWDTAEAAMRRVEEIII